jgi:hypothetical protein
MSKKKDRGWFICPQWAELISRHYASDIEAGRALKADPKVLSKCLNLNRNGCIKYA